MAHARRLIDAHQYVLESVWGDVQPSADDENAFLESHSWDDYAARPGSGLAIKQVHQRKT